MEKAAFRDLEPNDHVPPYLREALVSEIDFIRDTLQFATHFTDGFLTTALMSITLIGEPEA